MTHDFDDALDIAIDTIMYAVSNNNLSDQTHRRIESAFNEIRLIRKAALKMAVDGGWRDIESAPKDGQFLGWVVNAYGHKHVVNVVAKGGSYWAVNFDPECLSHGPIADKLITKWQPLPQPPKESEK